MNDRPEDLLRNAPRSTPSESLDRDMDALFDEARQSARPAGGWLSAGIPLWMTAVACVVCLIIGRQLAKSPGSALVQAPPAEVPPALDSPPVESPTDSPVVLVRVARSGPASAASPFIRFGNHRETRFASEWTVSQ